MSGLIGFVVLLFVTYIFEGLYISNESIQLLKLNLLDANSFSNYPGYSYFDNIGYLVTTF